MARYSLITRDCKVCGPDVLHAATSPPNHLLHLLLSIPTMGLWLIVWFFVTISYRPDYRCLRCSGFTPLFDAVNKRLADLETKINRLSVEAASFEPPASAETIRPVVAPEVPPLATEPAITSEIPSAPFLEGTLLAEAQTISMDETALPEAEIPPPLPAPKPPAMPVVGSPPPVQPAFETVEQGEYQRESFFIRLAQRWAPIEQRLLENWTGILGTVVLVAGIAFLGVYAAIKITPFYRFLMVVAAAAALFVLFLALRRNPAWRQLAVWLRSTAAAVLLFACAASGGLPGLGLQWLTAPLPALSLLLAGVGVNLFVAYAGGTATFASLHVVLSLIPLAIMPQSDISLILAAVVIACGIGLAFRGRWDIHLAVTLAASAAYQYFWYLGMAATATDQDWKMIGAGCAIAIAAAAALVHYRADYSSRGFEPLPFAVHAGNWSLFGLMLLIYRSGTYLGVIVLTAAGVASFLLARRGRTLHIRWLYVCDTLVAQALIVAAVISLQSLDLDILLMFTGLMLETALFLRLVLEEEEPLLIRTGVYLLHGAVALLACAGLMLTAGKGFGEQASILYAGLAIATLIQVYFGAGRRAELRLLQCYGCGEPAINALSMLGVIIGFLALAAVLVFYGSDWMEMVALGVVGGLILVACGFKLSGLALGAWAVMLIICVLLSWPGLLAHPEQMSGFSTRLQQLLPLAVLLVIAIRFPPGNRLRVPLGWIAIYLLGIHIGLSAYVILNPISPLLPATAWLCLSLIALGIANRTGSEHLAPVLHTGYFYLVCFVAAYLSVVLPSVALVWAMRTRFLIEMMALAVLGYWWLFRPSENLGQARSWTAVQPLFLEGAFLMLAATVMVEAAPIWRSAIWAVLAFAMHADLLHRLLDTRLRAYSLTVFWASIIDLVVTTSTATVYSLPWSDQPIVAAGVAVGMQSLYIMACRSGIGLTDCRFPPVLDILEDLFHHIDLNQTAWLYYPFFIGLGLTAYLLLQSTSPLIAPVLWLCLSLIILEFANRHERREASLLLVLGFLYLLAFAGAYVLVIMQIEDYWGLVRLRLLIELFALGAVFYWWLYRPAEEMVQARTWVSLHPLLLETALVLVATMVLLEPPAQWRALVWAALALALLSDPLTRIVDNRLRFYSLLFYWASIINMASVVSTFATPSALWRDRPEITGALSIALQVIYLLYSHPKLQLAEVKFPAGLRGFAIWSAVIQTGRAAWVYYPFFIGVALFLYWRFEKGLLTLLWTGEAFIVFALSIVLRENHFRYMALAALGGCLIRLLVYDLAQADMALRGIVFVGMGILMLGMNALYNRYRSRFQ